MLGLMGFSGSLPLYVIHRYYIFVFIDRANKDACLLACTLAVDGWVVTFGTARRGLAGAAAGPGPSSLCQM